jgi:hypothetical protein
MAAYRFYNPAPVIFDTLGVDKVANGTLTFYDIGTTTPRNTWSDADLTVLNTNPVECDSSGRPNVNIFLDGDYTVKIEGDNLDPITRDIVSGQSAGQTIPALETDEFLTSDGSNLLWRTILQLPDMTGQNGRILSTDGSVAMWIAQQVANATITLVAGGFKISNGTNAWMVQFGSDTLPASGTFVSSKAFVFGTAFSGIPVVIPGLIAGSATANPSGAIPSFGAHTISTTGGIMAADMNGYLNITGAVPFSWIAVGTVAP